MTNFGQILDKFIVKKKFTNSQVARMTGISQPSIIKIRAGSNDPKVSTLLKLTHGLKMPKSTLSKVEFV